MAGVARMELRSFTIFNMIGAALWAVGVTMIGFVLGKTIPSAEDHLLVIEAVIIVLSLVPIAVEVIRSRRHRARDGVPTMLGDE
jgi:membrane-associated protein